MALLRRNYNSTYFCCWVCSTLMDWCYWSNETSALSMAQICTLVVLPKSRNLKPSARCGKGWGTLPIYTMGQSLLVSGVIPSMYYCKRIFTRTKEEVQLYWDNSKNWKKIPKLSDVDPDPYSSGSGSKSRSTSLDSDIQVILFLF